MRPVALRATGTRTLVATVVCPSVDTAISVNVSRGPSKPIPVPAANQACPRGATENSTGVGSVTS